MLITRIAPYFCVDPRTNERTLGIAHSFGMAHPKPSAQSGLHAGGGPGMASVAQPPRSGLHTAGASVLLKMHVSSRLRTVAQQVRQQNGHVQGVHSPAAELAAASFDQLANAVDAVVSVEEELVIVAAQSLLTSFLAGSTPSPIAAGAMAMPYASPPPPPAVTPAAPHPEVPLVAPPLPTSLPITPLLHAYALPEQYHQPQPQHQHQARHLAVATPSNVGRLMIPATMLGDAAHVAPPIPVAPPLQHPQHQQHPLHPQHALHAQYPLHPHHAPHAPHAPLPSLPPPPLALSPLATFGRTAPPLFETAFINLAKRTDRLAAIRAELAKAGIAAARHEAARGEDAPPELVARTWDSRRNAQFDTKTVGHPAVVMSPGERGCCMSHRALWEMVAARPDDAPPVLVLEDDATLTDGFATQLARLLGAFYAIFPEPSSRAALLYLCADVAKWRGEPVAVDAHPSPSPPLAVREAAYLWQTVSYVIWPRAARELLRTARPIHCPVDVFLADATLHRQVRSFVSVPPLARQAQPFLDGDILHSNFYASHVHIDDDLRARLDANQNAGGGGGGGGVGSVGDDGTNGARSTRNDGGGDDDDLLPLSEESAFVEAFLNTSPVAARPAPQRESQGGRATMRRDAQPTQSQPTQSPIHAAATDAEAHGVAPASPSSVRRSGHGWQMNE